MHRKVYLLVILLGWGLFPAIAQHYTPIGSDTLNRYSAVSRVFCSETNNHDSLLLADASDFESGDTVLLYYVKGVDIGADGGVGSTFRNTGKYAFFILTDVRQDTVVLNTIVTPDMGDLANGEMAQLIRVPSYRYAEVPAGDSLWAQNWNPFNGTGGVLAFFVRGVLRLDGNITVNEAGFRGAPGSTDSPYIGDCSSSDTMRYYLPNYPLDSVLAGYKGEGITDTTFHLGRGKGKNINGGGGGNGRLAGGGGGSNYNYGAEGGEETTDCSPGIMVSGGEGGFDMWRWVYGYNADVARRNRILLGGGGGSGTRQVGYTTSDGGDGGGIVIIVADTIEGNGQWIRAEGGDVSGIPATGAAGGGGGGGCIILEVNGYKDGLNLSTMGGDGGNTFGLDRTGTGGAGGGGVYWLSGSSMPSGVHAIDSSAMSGVNLLSPEATTSAGPTNIVLDLVAPLKGFLFNPVPASFTICSDQIPQAIRAAPAKGGEGSYTYLWQDSTQSHDWQDVDPLTVVSNTTASLIFTEEVGDTTWYRRIVSSGPTLKDTSYRVALYVHPAITGNTVAAPDTVCLGNAPELMIQHPDSTLGGGPWNGTFTYLWQQREEGSGAYSNASGASIMSSYQAPGLDISTEFRRISYSGVCVDTSNVLEVRVLDPIRGNAVTPFDTICIYTTPDLVEQDPDSTLDGGDPGQYRYRWLISDDPLLMGNELAGETASSYQSPALDQTSYFRRVVLSGNDDACRDTSDYVELLVVEDILPSSNQITSEDSTVCQMSHPGLLEATSPAGGLGGYVYTWLSSTDQLSWVPATGQGPNDVETDFDPGIMDGETTYYRRMVESGGLELVCKDTSATLTITVLDSITNNRIAATDDGLCQNDLPQLINGQITGGEDRNRVYEWYRGEGEDGPASWVAMASGPGEQDYLDPDILSTDTDRWYRRIVITGPYGQCRDTSEQVHLEVHTAISGKDIDASQAICVSDGTTRQLRGETASGEEGLSAAYTWRRWPENAGTGDTSLYVPGSDPEDLAPGAFTGSDNIFYFDRIVQIGHCIDTSSMLTLTVLQTPGGELGLPQDFSACSLEEITQDISLKLSGPGQIMPPSASIPWTVYLDLDGAEEGSYELLSPDDSIRGIVVRNESVNVVDRVYSINRIEYLAEALADPAYRCVSQTGDIGTSTVSIEVARTPVPVIQASEDPISQRKFLEVCGTNGEVDVDLDTGSGSWTFSRAAGYAPSFIAVSGDGLGSPASYSFSVDPSAGEVYALLDPEEVSEALEDTRYEAVIRSSADNGCAYTDTIDLYFFETPDPPYAGRDTTIFVVDSLRLVAEPASAGFGWWQLGDNGYGVLGNDSDPYANEVTVYQLELNTENEFIWSVANGREFNGNRTCEAQFYLKVVTQTEVNRFNGFSPNGDMSNEYFIMQGLRYAEDFQVTFFNALGNTVRTVSKSDAEQMDIDPALIDGGLRVDEQVVWDGLSDNGQELPSGIYYYVVTFTNDEIDYQYTGHVELVREKR